MRSTQGLSLIEVLTSLLLLSIILLGANTAQITSMKKAKINYYTAAAEQQMRVLDQRLNVYKNSFAIVTSWNQQNLESLPQGKGNIMKDGPDFHYFISWGKKEHCDTDQIGMKGCLLVKI